MIFSLEALQADHGDCLLLHYGPDDDPELIIIDGGPHDIWRDWLEPRLEEIRYYRELTGPVEARLAMVSHIDRDHITGILDMMRDLDRRLRQNRQLTVNVQGLWHNSFDDLVGNIEISAFDQLIAWMNSAGGADIAALGVDLHSLMIAGDVRMGRELRRLANDLQLRVNSSFPGGRVVAGRSIPVGHGTTLRALGPSRTQLQALEAEWNRQLRRLGIASAAQRRALIASFTDRSVANLSSLVILVEQGNQRMLLTGDARGDFIIDAIRDANLLHAAGSVTFDILKVPHHGSDRNVTEGFFRTVRADNYVFSGDGTVGQNPDIRTLRWLTSARGQARYTMYFTNRLQKIVDFVRDDRRDNNRNYDVVYRDENYWSTWVDLGDVLWY